MCWSVEEGGRERERERDRKKTQLMGKWVEKEKSRNLFPFKALSEYAFRVFVLVRLIFKAAYCLRSQGKEAARERNE